MSNQHFNITQVQNSDNFSLNETAAEENEEAEVDRVDEEVPLVGPLEAGGVAKVEKQY